MSVFGTPTEKRVAETQETEGVTEDEKSGSESFVCRPKFSVEVDNLYTKRFKEKERLELRE